MLKENHILTNENVYLKSECNDLKIRINVLDKDISSIKLKYDDICLNVSKFNKSKENLNNLLSFQKSSNNHFGIGFVPKYFIKNDYVLKNNNKNIHAKQNKYIWIPKNLNIHDRNDYISSYMYEVCNSKNYTYVNKWKPNSKWIWIPKG